MAMIPPPPAPAPRIDFGRMIAFAIIGIIVIVIGIFLITKSFFSVSVPAMVAEVDKPIVLTTQTKPVATAPAPAVITTNPVPQAPATDPAVLKTLEAINANLVQLNAKQNAIPAQAVAQPAPSAPAVPVTTTAPAPATAPTQVTANPTQPATTKGPKIGDMNPNVDAVNVGTCKGVSNDDGLYIQSGEVGRCTSKLSELPAGSQLVVDGIQFSVNGVEYLNTIKAFDLGNATTLDIAITNGGAKLGPKDVAIKRFCTISRTATVNNWALPNREPVPAWGLKLDATKNCA